MTLLSELVEPIPKFNAYNRNADCNARFPESTTITPITVAEGNTNSKIIEATDFRFNYNGLYLFGFTEAELFEQFWRIKSITYDWNFSNSVSIETLGSEQDYITLANSWSSSSSMEVLQSVDLTTSFGIDGLVINAPNVRTPTERVCSTFKRNYYKPLRRLQRTYSIIGSPTFERTYEDFEADSYFLTGEVEELGKCLHLQNLRFFHVPDLQSELDGTYRGGYQFWSGTYGSLYEASYRTQGNYTYEELPFTINWKNKSWNGKIPAVQYYGNNGSSSISGSLTMTINEYSFEELEN